MQRVPLVRARIPDVEPVAAHEVFREERPRLRATRLERGVERLRLLNGVEHGRAAAIDVELQTPGAHRRQRGLRFVDLGVRGLLGRRVIQIALGIRAIGNLGHHHHLVHRAVHIHLRDAAVRRIQIEEAQLSGGRRARRLGTRRGEEDAGVAGRDVDAGRLERVRGGRHVPVEGGGLDRQRAERRERGLRHEVRGQLDVEDKPQRPRQLGMRLERAERLSRVRQGSSGEERAQAWRGV